MSEKQIYLIAEIGWNHMGDMVLAKEMISAAKESGAYFAKFQTWRVRNLKPGPWDQDGRIEIYRKAELTEDQHLELYEFCQSLNIKFLTSVFNPADLEMVSKIDNSFVKIPSHEIHNLDLISQASQLFNKVLISTGASNWNEVLQVADLIDKEKRILMHCVSAYPAEHESINLPKLKKISDLSLEYGYSGHHIGIKDAIAAIAMGATYIEKHFTLDNKLPGRDNQFAILPEQFKEIADFKDSFEEMSVDHGLDLQENELDIFTNYRGRWSK